jgi:hypothetical protein
MFRPFTIFSWRRCECSSITVTSVVGLANGERELLWELLTDTLGAPSLTAIAPGGTGERVEYAPHLPPLTFPAAVRAFPQPSPFCLGLGMTWGCRMGRSHFQHGLSWLEVNVKGEKKAGGGRPAEEGQNSSLPQPVDENRLSAW